MKLSRKQAIGGDAPGQWDSLSAAFTQQFPDMKINLITDLSKYHDARIDNQPATGDLVADAASSFRRTRATSRAPTCSSRSTRTS